MCNTVLCAICYVQYANEAIGRPICMQMEPFQIFKILQYFNKTVLSVQFWKKDFVISMFLKLNSVILIIIVLNIMPIFKLRKNVK